MLQVIGSASATIWFALVMLSSLDILSRISSFEVQQFTSLFKPYSNAIELAFLSYTWLITDLADLVGSTWGVPELLVAISMQVSYLILFAAITRVFFSAR